MNRQAAADAKEDAKKKFVSLREKNSWRSSSAVLATWRLPLATTR
jgi:hypothetical protein